MNGPLEGRTALIVGANGGIGRAIARALDTAGARLVLAARDTERLDRLAAELKASGIPSRTVGLEVTDDDALAAVVEGAAAEGMDIAVNNAGATHRPAPLGELSAADADRVLTVTLRGTLVAMQHELAALRDGGSIVNVVSTAGLAGAPGMAAYVAAKHGVVGLTRTAALDYADRGIRVNAVAPGSIDSGGIAAQPDEIKQQIGSFAPLARLGGPEEVAAAVLWLASPAASYTTGTILTVDGGKGARGA
ncbi:SDR family NAD(P)-dependent oxidoreductase [Gordonia sp. ABSL11-1]|uniref:SDR family NAD(P)-dependent oxidoreductase n=1 Tax=Gordonia sp. ABSL11-1 TaxID=3053924 RepID=UPI0025730EE4|nr:SDR family NAD(P)-dependent oxidoreductase [Gordonia sp. ABSL11-1]MDL9947654.1 SDR family NAD(P)-dependent oxidoreductase [Gordonia sp. ABSL11-1]